MSGEGERKEGSSKEGRKKRREGEGYGRRKGRTNSCTQNPGSSRMGSGRLVATLVPARRHVETDGTEE